MAELRLSRKSNAILYKWREPKHGIRKWQQNKQSNIWEKRLTEPKHQAHQTFAIVTCAVKRNPVPSHSLHPKGISSTEDYGSSKKTMSTYGKILNWPRDSHSFTFLVESQKLPNQNPSLPHCTSTPYIRSSLDTASFLSLPQQRTLQEMLSIKSWRIPL